MTRPRSLAEVATIGAAEPAGFGTALGEFADPFYLALDDEGRQACLDPVPEPIGEALLDAWIGAAGEHLALRWDLRVPGWVHRDAHSALRTPPTIRRPARSPRSRSSRARRRSASVGCSSISGR